MIKLTKTLLILPIIALTSVGCVNAEPRIETITDGPLSLTVNCTDKLIYDVSKQEWVSRSESVDNPSYEKEQLALFDGIVEQACG